MKQTRKQVSISIVIPAYNEAENLRVCLDSIAAQTVQPYEVIVVDNNSTDETAAVAGSYPFVRVITERNQGIVYARNAGFDAARGDIIGRIDADTQLPDYWVDRITKFYENPSHGEVTFTGGCYFYNLWTGQLTGRLYDFVVHHINRAFYGYYFPWGSNCALPSSVWRQVRDEVCMRTDVHEDLDLGLHLQSGGFRTIYDSRLRVGAVAKRLVTEHRKLWSYVMMWPFTIRIHGIKRWQLAWAVALLVWIGSYMIITLEYIPRNIKRRVHEASLEV